MSKNQTVGAETVQSETAVVEATAAEAKEIGVLMPSGSAESIAKCKGTPYRWYGVVLGSDGQEKQVTAQCNTRQGSLKIYTSVAGGEPIEVGSLSKPRDRRQYRGELLKDRPVQAFFKRLAPGPKTELRILIQNADAVVATPEAEAEVTVEHKVMSLAEMLTEIGPITAKSSDGKPRDFSQVPF